MSTSSLTSSTSTRAGADGHGRADAPADVDGAVALGVDVHPGLEADLADAAVGLALDAAEDAQPAGAEVVGDLRVGLDPRDHLLLEGLLDPLAGDLELGRAELPDAADGLQERAAGRLGLRVGRADGRGGGRRVQRLDAVVGVELDAVRPVLGPLQQPRVDGPLVLGDLQQRQRVRVGVGEVDGVAAHPPGGGAHERLGGPVGLLQLVAPGLVGDPQLRAAGLVHALREAVRERAAGTPLARGVGQERVLVVLALVVAPEAALELDDLVELGVDGLVEGADVGLLGGVVDAAERRAVAAVLRARPLVALDADLRLELVGAVDLGGGLALQLGRLVLEERAHLRRLLRDAGQLELAQLGGLAARAVERLLRRR